MQRSVEFSSLWIVDWSDEEDNDFHSVWDAVGIPVKVVRSRPTGPTVGRWNHRLYSWPAYAALATRALVQAHGGPVVAWQPISGALAGLMKRGSGLDLTLLNPLFEAGGKSVRARLVVSGSNRASRVIFFSRRAVDQAARLGLDRARLEFLPFGARASGSFAAPSGAHLLAVGRDGRDWSTLAKAVSGTEIKVLAVGAPAGMDLGRIRRIPQTSQQNLRTLMTQAAAVLVPLRRPDRTAGQLAVLLAMAVGRAVIATRAQGTEDYVSPETGILVPAGDPDALRAAIESVTEIDVASEMGRSAWERVRGPLSLERFVTDVDDLIRVRV